MKCLSRQRRLKNIFVYSGSRKISCSINDILHLCEDHCEKRDGKNSQKIFDDYLIDYILTITHL